MLKIYKRPEVTLGLISLVLLFSCYTPEKAAKQADKALDKYPEKVAPKFREAFPCEDMKIDTVYNWQNSTVYVECPPQTPLTDTFYLQGEPIKVPAIVKVKEITITKTIKDSAEVFMLKDTIESLKARVFTYKHNYENAERLRAEESLKYKNPLYLLIALIFSVLANLLQLRKSKTKTK